jgi:hypothetical protein
MAFQCFSVVFHGPLWFALHLNLELSLADLLNICLNTVFCRLVSVLVKVVSVAAPDSERKKVLSLMAVYEGESAFQN